MKIGLIGCGVIGERRIQNLPPGATLVGCVDPNQQRASLIANLKGCEVYPSAEALVEKAKPQALIVAAINSVLVPTLKLAADHGIAALVEKPAARSYGELRSLNVGSSQIVKIGFNHRFHPAYVDLLSEVSQRPHDPIMYITASYGNGSRLGFEKEWRARVELSGGGELLDQGVHVLDLASGLLRDLRVKTAWVRTQYWDMPVDDNAWAVLSTPKGQTFSMHVSCSEWKNEFRFEVYTRERKYQWVGLGRSYGPEKLTIFKMKPEMGPPDVEERAYPAEDQSWLLENTNFISAIQGEAKINGGYEDALRALKHVADIYEISKKTQTAESFPHPTWWQS